MLRLFFFLFFHESVEDRTVQRCNIIIISYILVFIDFFIDVFSRGEGTRIAKTAYKIFFDSLIYS